MNIIKKNKNSTIISIKDGFIIYKINIKEFSCQCSKNNNQLCNHILFILLEVFKLSNFSIKYVTLLSEVKTIFINLLGFDDLNLLLEEEIHRILDNLECGICLLSLSESKFNFNLYHCPICKNCVHSKCMIQWQNAKKIENTNKCIYCMIKT